MISSSSRVLAKAACRLAVAIRRSEGSAPPFSLVRFKSSSTTLVEDHRVPVEDSSEVQHALTPDGDVVPRQEIIRFPSASSATAATMAAKHDETTTPVLLNSKEHAVGYLSKILNARVYDAAIETELQEAKNLSTVRH